MRVSLKFLVLTVIMSALMATSQAEAKDLRQRLGVGFTSIPSEVPLLSVKYGVPSKDKAINLQLQGLLGADYSQELTFTGGGRLLYAVVVEDQLNLYAGVGGLFVSKPDTFTGLRVQAVMGTEFFLYGLDNLGLSLEFGVNADLGDTYSVGTRGGASGGLGMHYYF